MIFLENVWLRNTFLEYFLIRFENTRENALKIECLIGFNRLPLKIVREIFFETRIKTAKIINFYFTQNSDLSKMSKEKKNRNRIRLKLHIFGRLFLLRIKKELVTLS